MPPLVKKEKPEPKKQSFQPGSVLSRIKNLEVPERLVINVFGEPASGKTTFWSSFPAPILALVCSGIKDSGELRSVNTKKNQQRIQTIHLEDPVEEVPEICGAINAGKLSYNTVVVDHCTGMQNFVLRKILGVDDLPVQKSWGMAKREEWQQCNAQMQEILKMIADLNSTNVVFIAQERELEERDMGDLGEINDDIVIPRVQSALTPGTAGWLNYTCDYVCSTFIRPKIEKVEQIEEVNGKKVKSVQEVNTGLPQYCMRTGFSRRFVTKFRVPGAHNNPLPKIIVDPTYEKIMALIKERQ